MQGKAVTIIGGGDSIAAIEKCRINRENDSYFYRRWSFFRIF